jgi:ABC-type phosphate transport system permease subunit
MKTTDNDIELRNLIKEIKLDSPGNDFTSKVMNRVFEEQPVVEIIKNEKLLGKGFWIILLLFVALIAAMFISSTTGVQADGQLSKLIDGAGNGTLSQGYQSFFSNLGSLPLSIGGILLATSVLLFADRFLSQIMPHQPVQKSF